MNLKLTGYKGTRDLYPADMMQRNYIFNGWREVVEGFGYREYAAPLLEPLELYAAKSGAEIVGEQTYSFTDRGGRQMVIRPEMTPSIARMVAARRQETVMPARFYSIANFMRYERPQHGREREFWQLNFDLFGIQSTAADLEIIEMSHAIIDHFGATDDMFTIRVNDRRLTDFIMRQYLELDGEQTGLMIKLLDRFDKMERSKFDGQALAIVGQSAMAKLAGLIDVKTLDELPDEIKNDAVVEPVRHVLLELYARGVRNAVYDIRLMRGFDYYTGIVFEVFDEAPENRRAMFGGGRYDGLISLFGVESLPVVGAAPGETTFREFLLAHHLMPDFSDRLGPEVMVLTAANDSSVESRAAMIANLLRQIGLSVAVDYGDRKLDKKVKAAVKQHAVWLLFVGANEMKSDRYGVKNVATGEQVELPLDDVAHFFDNWIGDVICAQLDDSDEALDE